MTTNKFRLTGSDVFGRYCLIEMKRFGVPNEFYVHKCINSYRSNYYRDVPIKSAEGEYLHHGKCVDVVGVITCGVDETEVFAVPLDSIEFIDTEEDVTCHDVRQGGGGVPGRPTLQSDRQQHGGSRHEVDRKEDSRCRCR